MAARPPVITFANAKPEPVPKVHLPTYTTALGEMTQRYGIPLEKAEELAMRLTVLRVKVRLIEITGNTSTLALETVERLKKRPQKRERLWEILLLGNACILDIERSMNALNGETSKPQNTQTQNESDLKHSLRETNPIDEQAEKHDTPSYPFLVRHGEAAAVTLIHDVHLILLAMLKGMGIDEATMSEYGRSMLFPTAILETANVDDANLDSAAEEATKRFDTLDVRGKLQSRWQETAAAYNEILRDIAVCATKEQAHVTNARSEGRKVLHHLVLGGKAMYLPVNFNFEAFGQSVE